MTRTAVGGLKNDLQYAKSAFQSDFAYFPSVDSKAHFGDYISKSNWIKSRLKRIRANPRHPRHPRSIDPYTDMKTALVPAKRSISQKFPHQPSEFLRQKFSDRIHLCQVLSRVKGKRPLVDE